MDSDTWPPDEVFTAIPGELHSLWQAVDQDGNSIDMRVLKDRTKRHRNEFRKL